MAYRKIGLNYCKTEYMNWPVIVLVCIIAIAFITFLVIRNIKDERNLKNQLNNDYPKPKDDEGDIEIEEQLK
jgi:hypothetical protein